MLNLKESKHLMDVVYVDSETIHCCTTRLH